MSVETLENPAKEEQLKSYRERRDQLIRWVKAGEGTSEDRQLIEELDAKIKELES